MAYHITFAPQSNRASWLFTVLLTDYDDNPLDLTGCSALFHIRGNDDWPYPGLTASTDNGRLTFPDTGVIRWLFSRDEMQSLPPVQHLTGMTLTTADGSQTVQLSTGPLNIYDGVVPAI